VGRGVPRNSQDIVVFQDFIAPNIVPVIDDHVNPIHDGECQVVLADAPHADNEDIHSRSITGLP